MPLQFCAFISTHPSHASATAIRAAPTNPMRGPPRTSPAIPPATAAETTLNLDVPTCSPLPVPPPDYIIAKVHNV